jgi:predicted transcriptional regulator of viral defense system
LEARNGGKIPIYSSLPLADLDTHKLIASALPNGYFCNLTAVYHHALTNQIPNVIYWCHEKLVPQKRRSVQKISNTRMRSAFVKPHRRTNFVVQHNGLEIHVIARTQGSDHGVERIQARHSPSPIGSRITCLERTLIDAVVSPHYNGGVMSLCDYFRAARNRMNLSRLLDIYQRLNFVYPYAQSLGFFMEHSGMQEKAEALRSAYPPRQRFYVDHGAKTTWIYDERWMVSYPKGLVNED